MNSFLQVFVSMVLVPNIQDTSAGVQDTLVPGTCLDSQVFWALSLRTLSSVLVTIVSDISTNHHSDDQAELWPSH